MKQIIQRLSVFTLCALTLTGSWAVETNLKGRNVTKTQFTTPLLPHSDSTPVQRKAKTPRSRFGASATGLNAAASGTLSITSQQHRAPRRAADDLPRIYGCIEYSGSRDASGRWIDHTLCQIPTSDDEQFRIIIEDVYGIDGATEVNGMYYAAYHTDANEYTLYLNGYDIATGELKVKRTGEPSAEASDVAYNPVDGKVYGFFVDPDRYGDLYETAYYFGTIDYNTCTTTRIADMPRQMAAIAIDAAGKIYALDKQMDKEGISLTTTGADLYEIDASTGDMTLIGKTGLRPEYRTSACIDPRSGRMFFTLSPDDEMGYLYEIDTTNGAATLVYTFPGDEQIVGLYIPDSGVKAGSPASVTDLAATFPGGGVEGTLSFSLPATDVDGNPISGLLDYKVTANGVTIADDNAACGTKVTIPVSLPAEGLYNFSVIASNESGLSPEATLTMFVGHDTPSAPVVTASLDENAITVSWNPVTTAVNGGYIDPARITYRVTRYPDTVIIEDATTATSIVDKIQFPEGLSYYYYTVEATCAGITSQPGESDKIVAGNIIPPYTDDFNNIRTFDFYTVIDANNDGTKWGPYIGNLRIAYSDDATLAMDDWLITPPVMLEEGKAYRFSMDVLTGNPLVKESFEVKCGRGNSVADMTSTVIEKISVAHTEYNKYHGYIVPAETGIHYIGVHGCSDPDLYTITIDNLTISEPVNSNVPAEPAAITVVSRTNGELKADITVTAPSTDIAGNQLSTIDRIILKRDGAPVKTFESPAPGATLSFTDEVSVCDHYTYSAVAINEAGEGPAVEIKEYVGVLEPSNPSAVKMVETSTPGEVTISWDAPLTDIKGNELDPSCITYRIYVAVSATDMQVVMSGITGNECTLMATETPDVQSFAQFIVVAETLGGLSDGMPTPMVPVGKPYATPFRESFSSGLINSILATNSTGGATWRLFNDESGLPACDGDNGFIGSVGEYIDDSGILMTGKVDLSGLEVPGLTFYTYSLVEDGDLDDNVIEVYGVCDGETELLRSFVISDYTNTQGWIKLLVPLTAYENKTIQFHFKSIGRTYAYTFLDDIRVCNIFDNNLSISGISAPEAVRAGTNFTISAEIENNGLIDADGYTVDLYLNGEKVESTPGEKIQSYAKKSYSFTRNINVLSETPDTYKVVVVYSSDEYPTDNESAEFTVTPVAPTLPFVDTIEASTDGGAGVTLQWAEPNPANYIPDAITDDFESYESWATDGAGEWIFVDRDESLIGGFSDGSAFPGIEPNTVQSFWVFDYSTPNYNDYFYEPHSGSKFLAQMFGYKNSEPAICDDWAISPELFGGQQTVSLYARAMDITYPETFEILYSTGSTDPADFVKVKAYTADSDEWKCFNCTLPDGARRMAIRCTSNFRFMFFVDDVTFIPAPKEGELVLSGYNIYRDGTLINTVDNNVNNFTDPDGTGQHSYVITALYSEKGESRPSIGVSASNSAIDNVATSDITVKGGKGIITVTGAEMLTINVITPDGITVASILSAASTETFNLSPGLYIVTAGRNVNKVLVY